MNGIEHYRRAEELMEQATATRTNKSGFEVCYVTNEEQERLTRLANVHALLALSAAQADATEFKRELYRANGEELPAAQSAKERAEAKTARNAALAAAFID
ncbi:hypothetical protein ABZ402_15835 [Streptomyces mirabilis]|uniref:hypothetical protein n=1 Tax=Streptomyces mirabilis TaxID=68239 RepID=UPI0033D6A6EB